MHITPDFAQLKEKLKASWIAGDFGQIGKFIAKEGEHFVQRLALQPGMMVLDVACGTGNSAVPAAHHGAIVTGIDIAPNLLEQARHRAAAEHLTIQFDEGDAENLPYPDQSFDAVISMYGAMFAPRPERVASEFARVCKPGGLIAMANWTPDGYVGKSFRVTSQVAPPPSGIPAPTLWGDTSTVQQRLGPYTSSLTLTRQIARMRYPFSPKETVAFFRQYFGPTRTTFSRLDPPAQADLSQQLEALWIEHNLASDGTTEVEAEYLEIHGIRR